MIYIYTQLRNLSALLISVCYLVPTHSWALENALEINSKWIKSSENYQIPKGVKADPAKHVYIIKQMHLESGQDTKASKASIPQKENLNAIYGQLSHWLKNGSIKSFIAEGCENDMPIDFNSKVYGWSVQELSSMKDSVQFDDVVIDIPLKIQLKYGHKAATCGDNKSLIKETLDAMKNVPQYADIFFPLIKAVQSKDKNQIDYLTKNSITILGLPTNFNADLVTLVLLKKLHSALNLMVKNMEERNQFAIQKTIASSERFPVLVFGGIHAPGLAKGLADKGIQSTILVPVGYDEEMESSVSKMIKALPDPDALLRQRGLDPNDPKTKKMLHLD